MKFFTTYYNLMDALPCGCVCYFTSLIIFSGNLRNLFETFSGIAYTEWPKK